MALTSGCYYPKVPEKREKIPWIHGPLLADLRSSLGFEPMALRAKKALTGSESDLRMLAQPLYGNGSCQKLKNCSLT
jgi:hypothetical protein